MQVTRSTGGRRSLIVRADGDQTIVVGLAADSGEKSEGLSIPLGRFRNQLHR